MIIAGVIFFMLPMIGAFLGAGFALVKGKPGSGQSRVFSQTKSAESVERRRG